MNLFGPFLLSSLLLLTILSLPTQAILCSDHPRLFFHQKSSVRELLENESFISLGDVSREFLTCRGSQNVEWIYQGNGEPSKLQESSSIQIQTGTEDDTSYCMTSRISIYAKQSDTDLAKHSGKYICQEIGNNSNTASVHVFVGRRNAPAFLQSRKTISLVLGQENATDSSFLIPCATSTPFVNATLFKKPAGSHNSKFKLISTSGSHSSSSEFTTSTTTNATENNEESSQHIVIFDPRFGFRVSLPLHQNLSSFHGDYKCVAKIVSGSTGKHNSNENGDEDFVIYSLAAAPVFRAFPPESTVFISGILNFTCESSEESVILKEVKVRSSSGYDAYMYDEDVADVDDVKSNSVEDDIEETLEKTENQLHVANYVEMNPFPGAYGEFQCLSEKDKRVLHSWKYRVIGKKEEKLSGIKFNKLEGSFSCRSKSGLPAKLSFVSCRTPSECRINGICLEKSEGCRGYSNATKALCHRGNHFCGKIFYKGGSGLIRCIGDGIDQIRGFTDEANDLRLRMGFHKLKPSETAFLSLNQLSEEESSKRESFEMVEGEVVNLSLTLGYYYFLQPVQWAIKFANGSSMHVTPEKEDLHKTKLHRTVHAQIRVPIVTSENSNSSEIVGINALIPLRSSVLPSWKTITLLAAVKPVYHSSNSSKAQHSSSLKEESESVSQDVDVGQEVEGSGRADIQFDTEVEDSTTKIVEDVIDQSLQHYGNTDNNNNNPVVTDERLTLMSVQENVDATLLSVTDPSIQEKNSQDDDLYSRDEIMTTERSIEHI